MPESWDDALDKTPGESVYVPPPPKRPTGLLIAAAALIAVAAIAGYLYLRRAPVPADTTAAKPAAAPAGKPAGSETMPSDLPPLDQSDAIVRELVGHLSTHPRVAAWLATEGLIRNFTAVVDNIAEGKTPAPVLRVLKPVGVFPVIEKGDDIRIDPRGYDRYNGIADAVASIDPAGAARLYAALKPRIEQAYAELGNPGTTFDTTLEQAIVRLLEAPMPADNVRLKPKGATGYEYVDPLLEALPAAQKQVMRMGPRNAGIVQQRLRMIAQALNIPASRLPQP